MSTRQFEVSELPVRFMENLLGMLYMEDIFNLSMCSPEHTQAVVSARQVVPPIRMRIELSGAGHEINLYTDNDPEDDERLEHVLHGGDDPYCELYDYKDHEDANTSFDRYQMRGKQLECEMYWILRWDFAEKDFFGTERTKYNICGVDVETRKRPNNQDCHSFTAICPCEAMDTTINAVISQIFLIFPLCRVESLSIDFDRLEAGFDVKKAISAFQTVEKLSFEEHHTHMEEQVYLYKNLEVTKELSMYRYRLSYEEQFESKIKCSDEITCHNASWMLPEALLTMNCARVELKNTKFTAEHLVELIRKWFRTNDLDKIVNIEIENQERFDKLDLSEFNPKPWDPEVRDGTFHFKTFSSYCFKDGLDIERADGLLATIYQCKQRPQVIYFVVWHDKDPWTGKRISEEIEF